MLIFKMPYAVQPLDYHANTQSTAKTMAATAAAALKPANEWESPFDHIDESSFSVDPAAVTAEASCAVEEILRTIQMDAAPQLPPPVVTPINPLLQGMNYKVVRSSLSQLAGEHNQDVGNFGA
jgi:hypothetical protein